MLIESLSSRFHSSAIAQGAPGANDPLAADLRPAIRIEHTQLTPRELILARLAALVAVGAPPASYLANVGAATGSGISEQDVQEVMTAVAPVAGTARAVAAGGNMMRALGFAIAVAEDGADS